VRREYFEGMYAANPDPWEFATRWYERRKYALTLAALSRPHYRSAFEPGCSIGVLTEALALRCDRLLSVDLVDAAVRQCRTRTASLPSAAGQVEVRQWDATNDDWPDESFDLVVVSEILYYLDAAQAERFVRSAPRISMTTARWSSCTGDRESLTTRSPATRPTPSRAGSPGWRRPGTTRTTTWSSTGFSALGPAAWRRRKVCASPGSQ
jgi:Nodulation protein S (NodS)